VIPTLLLGLGLALVPRQGDSVRARSTIFAAGAGIPVRFDQSIGGGRDSVGAVVWVRTTAPLEAGGCVIVPAFSPIGATVVASKPGGLFGRRGVLRLRFDSLLVSRGDWMPLHARLDALEWVRRGTLSPGGTVRRPPRSVRGIVGAAGAVGLAAVVTEVGVVPVAAAAGLALVLHGPRAEILSGERATLRLTVPLLIPMPERCRKASAPSEARAAPGLPPLPPHAQNRRGTAGADPINLILRGTRDEVDSAFGRAGWLAAQRSTFGALAQEAEAVVLARRDAVAPMSHEYYRGRVEDLRFERASPSARSRHHVRLWQVDSTATLWAAAATEDVGMLVSARRRTVTHRVAPDVDRERDLLVQDLLAVGCAVLDGYVTLPGAAHSGTTVAHQPYVTDARAAVLRLGGCPTLARPF
jgi:hypothetical protein